MMQRVRAIGATCGAVLVAVALTATQAVAQQPILGSKLTLASKGLSSTTKLQLDAKEAGSLNTLNGDPAANGATVTVIANGGTSTSETYTLPGGANWRRSPRDPLQPAVVWKYADLRYANSPVSKLSLAFKSGKVKATVKIYGKVHPVAILPPNPATYIGVLIAIGGTGGDTYCLNYGGTAGGVFAANAATKLVITKPTSEGTCPGTTPVCGDGVIQAPGEDCDAGNDAACPGLCGTGLPCLCPYCGDGIQNAGEPCDGHDPGSCSEGCSYGCTCTTCGDNLAESPTEECDGTDEASCPGLCVPQGNPNQCQCAHCGDGSVNAPGEVCDGSDDSACPDACLYGCVCP